MKTKLPLTVVVILVLLIVAVWLVRINLPAAPAPTLQPSPTAGTSTPAPQPLPQITPVPLPSFVPAELLQQTSRQAGWSVLTPSWLPEGYGMGEPFYDAQKELLSINFIVPRSLPGADPALTEMKTITLVQSSHADVIPLKLSETVQGGELSINGQPARLYSGAWDASYVSNPTDSAGGHFEVTWRGDLDLRNLRWQVGDLYLLLITDDAQVSADDLVRIAENIH